MPRRKLVWKQVRNRQDEKLWESSKGRVVLVKVPLLNKRTGLFSKSRFKFSVGTQRRPLPSNVRWLRDFRTLSAAKKFVKRIIDSS